MKIHFRFLALVVMGLGAAITAWAWDGAAGKSGMPITVTADGTAQYYQNGGTDGGNGSWGHDGQNASCYSTGGPANVYEPSGGNGESGGSGGNGGSGGDITVRFDDVANVKTIRVMNTPGRGGAGGYGGRGGQGCNCAQSSWVITDASGKQQSFYCSSGSDGMNGGQGANGSYGAYGRVYLAPGNDPLKASMPAIYVDMAKMETGAVTISQNNWEKRKGARALFASGSDTSDTYYYFLGRKEAEVRFQWKANRPIGDFSEWQMYVTFEGTNVKVSFPSNAMVNSEVVMEGGKATVIIHSAVKTDELGYLQMGDLSGHDATLALQVKDTAKVSDIVQNTVNLEYQTVENGYYKVRFQGDVPAAAVTSKAGTIDVAMAQVGIKEDYLKPGLKTYVNLVITRSLGGKAYKYQLGEYYTIRGLDPGALVEATEEADMYTGTTVVGHVAKGDKFKIVEIRGEWVSLTKLDGTAVKGWIKIGQLKVSEGEEQ